MKWIGTTDMQSIVGTKKNSSSGGTAGSLNHRTWRHNKKRSLLFHVGMDSG